MEKTKSRNTKERHILANIAIGSLSSLIMVLVLLMILAAFTSGGSIPESFMGAVVLACCFISAFVGARIAISRTSDKKLLIGAGEGAFTFVLVFAIGRAASANATTGPITLCIFIALLAGGVIGGYLGREKRKSNRR